MFNQFSIAGLQHRFSPEQIGIQASSALAYIIFEMILYLVTLYVTNTSTALTTLDLLAHSGYKYTTMICSLLAGLLLGRTGYYSCLLYCSLALSYFLVSLNITIVILYFNGIVFLCFCIIYCMPICGGNMED